MIRSIFFEKHFIGMNGRVLGFCPVALLAKQTVNFKSMWRYSGLD
jgi:hypothetical protein